eukprot:7159528-Prymnesium_polylepis.1
MLEVRFEYEANEDVDPANGRPRPEALIKCMRTGDAPDVPHDDNAEVTPGTVRLEISWKFIIPPPLIEFDNFTSGPVMVDF